ncbi:MAG TPA: TerC family protein [Beijerinckiaceae bacterium]|nr:TerC family protein [Beijerinckiaceae bacterium]
MNGEIANSALQILEIVWINLLLSGDNAVVIALACRSLPPERRRIGIALGACAAIGLRVIFTLIIVTLLALPFLKLAGGAALLWISVRLLGEEHDEDQIADSKTVWRAVRTIAIADAVMSLDNVIAIAAAANGSFWLIVFGLVLSIPLIIFGAGLVSIVIDRFPILVWAGAALLGWVAGELAASDPAAASLSAAVYRLDVWAGAAGAVFVMLIGLGLHHPRTRRRG